MVKKKGAKKILLVEDEALLAEMYRELFEKEGFDIMSAGTGEEAISVALKEKPAFILLDILLPESNGIYFLEQRSQDPEIADIPVIAFSNFDDPKMKESALSLGAKDYLIKTNYTPQEVVAKVKQYVK